MEEYVCRKIEDRLSECILPQVNELSAKTLESIVEIENYNIFIEERIQHVISELKRLKISKVSIASSKAVNLSRKTIYNNDILNIYIEHIIKNQFDIMNERKIEELKIRIEDLTNENKELIRETIKYNLLLIELKELQDENKHLKESIGYMSEDGIHSHTNNEKIKDHKVIEFKSK